MPSALPVPAWRKTLGSGTNSKNAVTCPRTRRGDGARHCTAVSMIDLPMAVRRRGKGEV